MERRVTSDFFGHFSLHRRVELREMGIMEGDNLIYTLQEGFRYARTLEELHGLPRRVGDATIDAITSVVWFDPSDSLRRELLKAFAA